MRCVAKRGNEGAEVMGRLILKVKLIGSAIGCTERQRATLRGLGLTRREKVVALMESPAVRGMLRKVAHLVRVEQ